MAIKIRSAKNKGYSFQKTIATQLLTKFTNIKDEEIVSAPSSINGEDLILSENARKTLGNVNFELKRTEKLSLWAALEQSELESKKYDSNPIVVFKRNRSKTYATIEFDFLVELLHNNMKYNDLKDNQNLDIDKLKSIFTPTFLKTLQNENKI